MEHPASGTGAIHFILLGAAGTLVALVIAQFFPSIIPSRASTVKL
jgi:hypothetical protein